MLKILRAKIINCSSTDYWYKDLVGEQVYCLERHYICYPFIYEIIYTNEPFFNKLTGVRHYFNKHDILVLEEFDGDLIDRTYIEIVRKDNEKTQS